MPNWKKLITSGSDASLTSLSVDTFISASSFVGDGSGLTGVTSYTDTDTLNFLNSINALSGSALQDAIDTEKARIDAILLSAGADTDSFAEIVSLINSIDTDNDTAFASFYTSSNERIGALESFTSSLENNTLISSSAQILQNSGILSSSVLNNIDVDGKILFQTDEANNFLDLDYDHPQHANSVAIGGRQSVYVFIDSNNSGGGNQFGIYNNITSTDNPVDDDAIFLVRESGDVEATSFTGSFTGDGSGLTGVSVAEATTISDTLTNVTSSTITHNFDSYNITITAYDQDKKQVIPESVTLTTLNTADITFCSIFSGTIVVAKGGHIVSGVYVDEVSTVSDTFSNVTSYTASHPFDTKNVYVTVYDDNDQQMLPETVTTSTNSTVTLNFCEVSSGRVLIAKAGHIVSGSIPFTNITDLPTLISGSDQITSSLDSRYVNTNEVTGSNVVGSDTVTSIETMTSAAYAAITPQTNVLYIITD